MTVRASHIVLVLSAFLSGLVIFFGVFLFASGQLTTGPSAAVIGGPFSLIDQDGKPITDQDFKGRPFLVFFGYTHCPDICPATLFEVSEVLRALGPDAGKAAALFITVDPERDTPDAIKSYVSSFDPHLKGLTGDPAAVARILGEYRVYAKKVPLKDGDYTMDHTAIVYLMDKSGQFVAPFSLKRRPEEAAADLRRYF